MFGYTKDSAVRKMAKEANEQFKYDVKGLNREIKELNEYIEDLKDDMTTSNRQHQRAMVKKDGQIADLKESVDMFEELQDSRMENEVTKLGLDNRATILDAKEKQYQSFEKELKSAKTAAEAVGEEQYKTGYSDGLADGLRKIHQITAEDRKMSMQVALVAASSHQPGAAKKIAEKVSTDMMLGAGDEDEDDSED